MTATFEYGTARVKDIQVHVETDKAGKETVAGVELNGQRLVPTNRFWNSLHVRFGFTSNIFRYFSHAEVFNRISEKCPNDQLRYCVEHNDEDDHNGALLGVTNPTAAVIQHDDLMSLLTKYGSPETRYHNGVVTSRHSPRVGGTFQVAGDGFQNKFVIDTPIDGYGRPAVYLSMLRLICANGAIGYSPAFRSELSVGKGEEGAGFALIRVLDGFNNEDGYAAMRQRFESAAKSWASVYEANRLYKLLARLVNGAELHTAAPVVSKGGDGASLNEVCRSPLFHQFHKMTGNLSEIYGLANLDTLTVKRQRTLPAACRVYDLINFASEVATHHATEIGNRRLQAFIGEMISSEYDLEGTCDQFADWRDFFLGNGATTQTLASLHQRSK